MNAPECPAWCSAHIIEEDTDGSAVDVHRGQVTRGGFVVTLEDSPSWPEEQRHQIVPPDLPDLTPSSARDLAAALNAAADLME